MRRLTLTLILTFVPVAVWAQQPVQVTVALPAGTNNIGDVDVLTLIPGVTATSLGKAEDAVAGSGDTGVMVLGVRQDSQVDFAADGDYVPFSVDGDGGLRVSVISGTISAGGLADDADFTDGTTVGQPIGGVAESASPSTVTEGDFGWVAITLNRAMKVSLFDTAGTALSLAADATVGSAGPASGPFIQAAYKDFDGSALPTTANVNTEEEAVPFAASLVGVQYVMLTTEDGSKSPVALEDAASADGMAGQVIFAIRDDTLDVRSATEGDFEPFHTNTNGALWVIDVNSAAHLTSTQLIDDAVFVDGAAFTPDTSKGFAVGFQADDTSPASVTEGDFGVPRMSLDRLIYTRTLDPCSGIAKTFIPINISSATTTELTPSLAGASTNWYVCSLDLVTAAANNVALVDDNTDGCGSVTAGLAGGTSAASGWNLAANGGLVKGNGTGTVFKSVTANSVLCLVTSASTQLSGSISVVAAP